jgi:hypothetical protein
MFSISPVLKTTNFHSASKNIVYLYSLFNAFLYVRFVINKELQDIAHSE